MVRKPLIRKLLFVLCIWICLTLLVRIHYLSDKDNSYGKQFDINEHYLRADMEEILNEPSKTELLSKLLSENPNTPFEYWVRQNHQTMLKPNLLEFEYHNNYWQTFRNGEVTFQLFGAYYDNRASLAKGPLVRILAMVSSMPENFDRTYCQLWFDEKTRPTIVPVDVYKPIWIKKWGTPPKTLFPYLLSCRLPTDYQSMIPKTVSLVSRECDTAGNNLRVDFELPPAGSSKQDFAVCVKGLDYPHMDISMRLIEWLELMRLLGAHKVYTYKLALHPNMQKVLDYYQDQGFVDVRPLSLATSNPNLPYFQHLILKDQLNTKRLNELIPYNDCFYRNMHKYKYIAGLDVDEVIMPLGELTSWQDLMNFVDRNQTQNSRKSCAYGYAGVCFHNVYFSARKTELSDKYIETRGGLSKAFHMLRHVARDPKHMSPGINVKCFHNTTEAEILHNHFSLSWLKACPPLEVKNEVGQLQHYHIQAAPHEEELVLDGSVWRYKNKLVERATKVLKDLGYFKADEARF